MDRRGVLALLLIATYVTHPAGPAGPVPLDRAEAASVACPAESVKLDAARAAARGCRAEVPVSELTTEFDRAWAQPDGAVRYEHRYRPVRVKRDGRWVPVDTTLRADADGTVRPIATAAGVVFSGGGTGAMVEVSDGDATLRLGSPVGDLPEPVLQGDTAVYSEVLPGVDLRLTADVDGYSQVLVVKNRRAAADPRLAATPFS